MSDATKQWVEGYRRAWESNDPDDIRALFTEDAVYRDGPSTPGWVGHEAIVEGWLRQRDEPGTTGFEWQPLVTDGEVSVVRCVITYPDGENSTVYDNLWVIRLAPDGRATEYTDWFIARDPA
jgi:hypothetical protein